MPNPIGFDDVAQQEAIAEFERTLVPAVAELVQSVCAAPELSDHVKALVMCRFSSFVVGATIAAMEDMTGGGGHRPIELHGYLNEWMAKQLERLKN